MFRAREKVYDPDTGRPLGWNAKVLGWLAGTEGNEETSLAEVRMAYSEMRIGDRIFPREVLPIEVEMRPTPPGVQADKSWLKSQK